MAHLPQLPQTETEEGDRVQRRHEVATGEAGRGRERKRWREKEKERLWAQQRVRARTCIYS